MNRFIPQAVFAVLVVLTLFSASSLLRDTAVPAIPGNSFHSPVIRSAGCRACHTPGSQAPLKGTHVRKDDCMTCHKARRAMFPFP